MQIHVPEGICYECSGCGNCCFSWPVPLTDADVVKLTDLALNGGLNPPQRSTADDATSGFDGIPLRKLNAGGNLHSFTHTLEKREDGRCAFLTESNRCQLQEMHGADAKPAMCRLFPYAYNETPSGAFVYVSFASSGMLTNFGRPLEQQREAIAEHYRLYKSLFPHLRTDWSNTQICDGFAMTWEFYAELEKRFLEILKPGNGGTALSKLQKCSEIAVSNLPKQADPERMPPLESRPKTVDQIILKHLNDFYLPPDLFTQNSFDLDTRALMKDLVKPPQAVSLETEFGAVRFSELIETTLGKLPDEAEDMLNRFIYCRVFAKHYFGPSFGHFSLLTGLHHLAFLIALIRLRSKVILLKKGSLEFMDIAEVLRSLERRFTQVVLQPQSSAALEVLLASPSRLQRLSFLAK